MTLIRFARRLIDTQRLLNQQQTLLNSQNQLIADLLAERELALRRTHLHCLHEMRALAGAWLLSMEQPELDIREDVAEMDDKFAHQIARLEEHVV